MPYAALIVLLIAADQLVKYLVRAYIPLHAIRPMIPGFIELTYVRNTGAAFSILREHTWILTLISLVVAALMLAAMLRRVVTHPLGLASLSLVLAGAVGNLIDRFLWGYVIDMFNFMFIRFAVFNVADICIVIGGIATCVYLLFFYDKWEAPPAPECDNAHHTESDC